jgi:hypothetical protein
VQRIGVGISVSNVLFASRHRDVFLILRVKIFYLFRTSSECEELLRTIGVFCDVPDAVKEECFADQSCLQNTQAAIHNEQLQDTLMVSYFTFCVLIKCSTVNFL